MLIGDVVRWHGHKTPQKEAIRWDDNSMTYGQLLTRVNRVANAMSAIGNKGDRVGILGTNRVAFLEVLFGALSLGATVVPMNYRAGKDEAAHLIADSGTKVLVTEQRYTSLVDSVRPASLEHVLLFDGDRVALHVTGGRRSPGGDRGVVGPGVIPAEARPPVSALTPR